jgi:hypothetical protein
MSRRQHACPDCISRSWLLRRLSGHLEQVRARIEALLGLPDDDLIAAVGGRDQDELRAAYARTDLAEARKRATLAGVELVCRCDSRYPPRLLALPPRRRCFTSPAGWTAWSRSLGPIRWRSWVGARRLATAWRWLARSGECSPAPG